MPGLEPRMVQLLGQSIICVDVCLYPSVESIFQDLKIKLNYKRDLSLNIELRCKFFFHGRVARSACASNV
jgi:hypothetical protein